jgi:hypothetical protein
MRHRSSLIEFTAVKKKALFSCLLLSCLLRTGVRCSLPAWLMVLAAMIPLASACCVAQDAAQTAAATKGIPVAPAPSAIAPAASPAVAVSRSVKSPVMINGRPYERPTPKQQFRDYLNNSYGWPALATTAVRALYAQGTDKPAAWGQDWPGFGQRFGSSGAVTVIDGNVRYGMEMLFKEDMRYIPCHGCSAKRTGHTAIDGFVGSRLIFATRIGGHLFTEFVMERRHHDPKLPD